MIFFNQGKILSISEYELLYTLVGLSIVGVKFKLCKDEKIFGILASMKAMKI